MLKLLEQAKNLLGLADRVELVLYPMKHRVATASLKTKTIRLNKNLLDVLDDDEILYILIHELIHIKLSTLSHGRKFYELLHRIYSPQESEELENRIVEKIIRKNMAAKNWLT
ncbi:SprT-like domain-containing protein [Stetteria hydrogenophila]